MNAPPREIDNATVLFWAWSGQTPFGFVSAKAIYGLAICQYRAGEFYRFSCDANWETQQDQVYGSAREAMEQLPSQYKNVEAVWFKRASAAQLTENLEENVQ